MGLFSLWHHCNDTQQDSKDVFVLGSIEDITVALEDSLVTISTIVTRRKCFARQNKTRICRICYLLFIYLYHRPSTQYNTHIYTNNFTWWTPLMLWYLLVQLQSDRGANVCVTLGRSVFRTSQAGSRYVGPIRAEAATFQCFPPWIEMFFFRWKNTLKSRCFLKSDLKSERPLERWNNGRRICCSSRTFGMFGQHSSWNLLFQLHS